MIHRWADLPPLPPPSTPLEEMGYFLAKYPRPEETGSILMSLRKMLMMVHCTEQWQRFLRQKITFRSEGSDSKFLCGTSLLTVSAPITV